MGQRHPSPAAGRAGRRMRAHVPLDGRCQAIRAAKTPRAPGRTGALAAARTKKGAIELHDRPPPFHLQCGSRPLSRRRTTLRLALTRGQNGATRRHDRGAHDRFAGRDRALRKLSRVAAPRDLRRRTAGTWMNAASRGPPARRGLGGAPAQIIAQIAPGIMRERSRTPLCRAAASSRSAGARNGSTGGAPRNDRSQRPGRPVRGSAQGA